jgi:hypothetical protein
MYTYIPDSSYTTLVMNLYIDVSTTLLPVLSLTRLAQDHYYCPLFTIRSILIIPDEGLVYRAAGWAGRAQGERPISKSTEVIEWIYGSTMRNLEPEAWKFPRGD